MDGRRAKSKEAIQSVKSRNAFGFYRVTSIIKRINYQSVTAVLFLVGIWNPTQDRSCSLYAKMYTYTGL